MYMYICKYTPPSDLHRLPPLAFIRPSSHLWTQLFMAFIAFTLAFIRPSSHLWTQLFMAFIAFMGCQAPAASASSRFAYGPHSSGSSELSP